MVLKYAINFTITAAPTTTVFYLLLVQLKCFFFIIGAITNINTRITNDTVATIAAAPADPHSDHIHTTTNNTTTTTAQN